MIGFLSLYKPGYSKTLIYMLQSTEYQSGPFLRWYWRTSDFSQVAKRRDLKLTKAARLLLLMLRLGILLEFIAGLVLIWLWYSRNLVGGWQYGLALIIAAPVLWAHLILVPLVLGRWLIVKPQQWWRVRQSRHLFKLHKGITIAVAGSYGKTTMKELLATVLGAGKKVAATPANRNVASSHAVFARGLTGGEDVLIIEYGEGRPGDVRRFVRNTHPNIGVITGLAPAHLDQYRTLKRAGKDIMSLAAALPTGQVYITGENEALKPFLDKKTQRFSQKGVAGWKVSNVSVAVDGTRFTLKKGSKTLKLHSGLLGRHQIGPLTLAAHLASELGMSDKDIVKGVEATEPFEHRMQPRVISGAWVIDDTYNGNIEGVRVGTALLRELEAKRKIYVTPGLVDQGHQTSKIHREMGQLIGKAKPDLVVLMNNSATSYIRKGLEDAVYKGEIQIEDNPLEYYTNLNLVLAAGDLVLMQNDWTDNYA